MSSSPLSYSYGSNTPKTVTKSGTNLSDKRLSTFKILAAQLRSVTDIALKLSLLCVNRSAIWYGFNLDPRALLRMTARDEELWGTLEQDYLWLVSAKNNEGVSDWSIQVRTRAGERAACLACEQLFPWKCWSKHARPILDLSDSKTKFARLIRPRPHEDDCKRKR